MAGLVRSVMDLLVGSCEETSSRMSSYLENDLRAPRRWRVSAHLSRCERCSEILRSLRRVVEQIRSLGAAGFAPDPSPSVERIVIERIERERPVER